MSQQAYNDQGQLIEGMKADSGFDDIRSGLAEGIVPFGRFVSEGTDLDRQVQLPSGATDITDKKKVRGVAVSTHAIESELGGSAVPSYKDKDAVSYMREGRIAVFVEEAVTPQSAVFVRHTSGGGGSEIGRFRTDADTASAAELANARYVTSTTGAGVAILELNLAG